MKILVTGAAGFIGSHLTKRLITDKHQVVGIDNLNDYYDVKLKKDRLTHFIGQSDCFDFKKIDITNNEQINQLFFVENFDIVVNLAAQAGVRYSIENPRAYIDANILGFTNILEGCRHNQVKHCIFASTSSVYGANTNYPFSERANVDHPVSFYAATKKANELMAHSYASLYQLPCTGLRFFTVYGPWGRPDMALFKFAQNIIADQPIDVYNNGHMVRDFTYIDDIIEGIMHVIQNPAKPNSCWSGKNPDPATSFAPYRIYNIGNGSPVQLLEYIETIEKTLKKKAIKNLLPMQAGDVHKTAADTKLIEIALNYKPTTPIQQGINLFIDWYLTYYRPCTD